MARKNTKADAPEVESTKATEDKTAPEGPVTSEDLPATEEPFDPEPQVTDEQPVGEPEDEPADVASTDVPPPDAPVVEDSPGTFKIISRAEGADQRKAVKEARFVGWNLHIVGEDFPAPGEVVIDIARKEGYDHQRFSAWTDSGMVDVVVPGITGTGDWEIHLESLITKVGEGNEDGLPLVLETEPVKLTLY